MPHNNITTQELLTSLIQILSEPKVHPCCVPLNSQNTKHSKEKTLII